MVKIFRNYLVPYRKRTRFELVTRGFELVTRRFELVTREFELVTREFELVDLNLHF